MKRLVLLAAALVLSVRRTRERGAVAGRAPASATG